MCGIHGILHLDGSDAPRTLPSAMGAVTRHRGPDDEGLFVDGPLAMGMRRLSIIDLAGGHQPLTNADGTLVLVANGEIYNFRELRADLESKGHRFKTGSDCEVILHLYADGGEAAWSRLNGMYDFALWDAPRRRLLLSRDRLGVKPLYVWRDAHRIAFATEAKALLEIPGVRAEADPRAIAAYLHLGYVPAPLSIFKNISKLLPATTLVAEGGVVTTSTTWSVPSDTDHARTESEWVDAFREGMRRAVRMQMVSDVPIGAFLSGGVDSSAVVGFMAEASAAPINTYAIGFEGGPAEKLYDELPYARRVATLFKTHHKEIVVTPDVVGLLPKLLWHMDEPIADTAFITTWLVSEFASKDVKVILSGVGGDELFGGYRRYLGNHYLSRFDKFPRWTRRLATRASALLPADRHSKWLNTLRLAKGFLAAANLSFEDRYRSYVAVLPKPKVAQLMRSPVAPSPDALTDAFSRATGSDPLNRMFAVDALTQLPDDLLLLTDKMTMAASIECRVPLLDQDLVELAARCPHTLKVKGGRLKHLMKRALADMLPADILDRPKRGFGTPMGAWIKGRLAPVVDALLCPATLDRRGWFDVDAVATLIRDHAANRIDGTDAILALVNLEIWARLHLDRRTPDDIAAELEGLAA